MCAEMVEIFFVTTSLFMTLLLCIYVDCTYILKPLIFFSSRFESIYCSHFSICHFNCIVIRFWIFGTILFVWNNVCRTQTSLWHYFSLCCGYGWPLFCHSSFIRNRGHHWFNRQERELIIISVFISKVFKFVHQLGS